MSENARLLGLLRRIRRRLRILAAVEGAFGGGALVLGLLCVAAMIARARGGAPSWRPGFVTIAVAACFAAVGAAVRRVPLARCARLLDAALDRGERPRDRTLSALSFVDGPDTLLSRAAIADALVRAGRVGPALVAPARRPQALPALLGTAVLLAVVVLVPARAPAARHPAEAPATLSSASTPRLRIAGELLDAERDEARAASQAATHAGDDKLANLGERLRAVLEALTNGHLGRGEALDQLRELAAKAREAADDAVATGAALRTAGQALEPTAPTRAAGRALGAIDPDATARALRDLAAREGASMDGERAQVARALESAGAVLGAGADSAEAGLQEEARRRLRRDPPAPPSAGAPDGPARVSSGERQLERLRRELDEAAAGCRAGAEACARQLRDGATSWPRIQRQAQSAAPRRRLESAVRQLRERLQRGDLDRRATGQSEKAFQRAAQDEGRQKGEGEPSSSDEEGSSLSESSDDPAMADAEGDDDVSVQQTEPAPGGAAAGTDVVGQRAGAAADGESGQASQGQGAGHEPGGAPLGRAVTPPTRGREREAHLRGGAGPTRAQTIEASARRGFASADYVRVFNDYHPVVEESLATAAVPEGQRYIVRRYFQLIRPRAPRAP